MKLIGRYYLLCDACNWEFTGFAVPGTVSSKPNRRKSKKEVSHVDGFVSTDDSASANQLSSGSHTSRGKKKKIRTRHH